MTLNNNNPKNTYSGVSFTGLLTIVFITLKLVGVIDWSWWWVISPTWIAIVLAIVIYLIVFIYLFIKKLKEK